MGISFGKLFNSMYDGSLATHGSWQAVVTMQQFIGLADADGVVDMTAEAISRRTTIPLEIIQLGIPILEAPDPYSRSPLEDGRRIVLLDPLRPWGWRMVNHEYYRNLRTKADKADLNRKNYLERKRRAEATAAQSDRSQTANSENSYSAHTEAEAEAEADTPLAGAREESPDVENSAPRVENSGSVVLTDREAADVRDIARRWTLAANYGMCDNPALRGAARPITLGRGDSLDVVERAMAAGVRDDAIAERIVYKLAQQYEPRRFGDGISSLAYVRDRLIEVYPRELARLGPRWLAPLPNVMGGPDVDVSPTPRGPGSGGALSSGDRARADRIAASHAGALAAADSLGLPE